MRTLGGEFRRSSGVPAGFDLLRAALATAVLVYHAPDVTQGPKASLGWAWLLGESMVPAFFVLSGFLIARSAERRRVGHFLVNRFLRIMPAFALVVAASVLLMGPALTRLPLGQYFSAPETWQYFLNLLGKIRLGLPGVFEQNPDPGSVNASLWSIRWEIGCYLLMAAAAWAGLVKRPQLMVAACLLVILAPPMLDLAARLYLMLNHAPAAVGGFIAPHGSFFHEPVETTLRHYPHLAHKLLALVTGWHFRVVPFFAAGALAYRLRERIPYSPAGAWCAAGLVIALSAALPREWSNPLSYLLLTAPLSYLILTLGVSDLRPPPPFRSGDYSYGIYLYAFPVQQMVVASGVDRGSWVLNVLVSLPIVTILAALSWRYIEKKLLLRRTELAKRFEGDRTPCRLPANASSGNSGSGRSHPWTSDT